MKKLKKVKVKESVSRRIPEPNATLGDVPQRVDFGLRRVGKDGVKSELIITLQRVSIGTCKKPDGSLVSCLKDDTPVYYPLPPNM